MVKTDGLLFLLCMGSIGAVGQSTPPTRSKADSFEQEVIERTNTERAKQNLPPLKRQSNLSQAARWMAKDMAEKGYFDHTDRQGREISKRLPELGYTNWRGMGENIALGQKDAAAVVSGWMSSPGHRANILNPDFKEIGVGVAFQGRRPYWVQDFGSRADEFPVIINNEAAETRSAEVRLYLYGKGWAEEMRLSNDGKQWTDWQPFTEKRNWTLDSRPGSRSVFVELRRGSKTVRAQDSIELLP